jgi:hypothetical protein
VSSQDLREFLAIQEELWSLNHRLSDEPDFVGHWVEWSPLQIYYSFSRHASDQLVGSLDGFSRQDLLVVHSDAAVGFEVLESELRKLASERDAGRLPPFDGDIDIKSASLVLTVPSNPDSLLHQIESASDSIVKMNEDVPLRIEVGPLAEIAYNGGNSITGNNSCTAGFTVGRVSSSWHGVLSAGHTNCNAPGNYAGVVTSVQVVRLADRQDVSVHRISSGTPRNRINISVSPFTRDITSSHTWSQLGSGHPVCKQGRATSWTCGTVVSKNVSPTYVFDGNRFVRTSARCQRGDSGGPHVHGNRAYGITSGFFSNGDCVFGSIDYQMTGTGWYVRHS